MIPKKWNAFVKSASYDPETKRLSIKCVDKDFENLLFLIGGIQTRKRGLDIVVDLKRSRNIDILNEIDIIHIEE